MHTASPTHIQPRACEPSARCFNRSKVSNLCSANCDAGDEEAASRQWSRIRDSVFLHVRRTLDSFVADRTVGISLYWRGMIAGTASCADGGVWAARAVTTPRRRCSCTVEDADPCATNIGPAAPRQHSLHMKDTQRNDPEHSWSRGTLLGESEEKGNEVFHDFLVLRGGRTTRCRRQGAGPLASKTGRKKSSIIDVFPSFTTGAAGLCAGVSRRRGGGPLAAGAAGAAALGAAAAARLPSPARRHAVLRAPARRPGARHHHCTCDYQLHLWFGSGKFSSVVEVNTS